jgi:YegS/Rv2252/BmrU family lipid kinase
MESKRTLFIVNPAAGAGRGATRWAEFAGQLRQDGIRGDEIATECPGDAIRLAREAARDFDLLVAVGGDGTVFEVANGILRAGGSRAGLGIVPFGTGNDAAELSGIRNVAEARRALREGRTRAIDVVEIRCELRGERVLGYALLYAAVGIVGEVRLRTTPRVKRLFGQRLAYPVGLLRALWIYRAPAMRVTCDGQTFTNHFLAVCASNSAIAGGGMRLAPGARADDGLLNVNLIAAMGRWRALAQVLRVCRGTHVNHPNVRYFPARTVVVETDPPIEVQADGDLLGHTPGRFEVRPQALRLLVP